MIKDDARTFTGPISRDRQKKTDEVFTPIHIVDHMIDMVSDVDNLGVTMFEPAAGDGNFVVRVIERKIKKAGVTRSNAIQAVSDVYACEYMRDNWEAIIARIGALLAELNLTSDWQTDEIRDIALNNIAYCNTIDHTDISEGRKYPDWLLEARGIVKQNSLENLFDI
ncbi:hypothetical protein Ah1_00103 [Aeromonas phage Ah1]|uniref:DNA methylase adenine-specific domain-containing protein n=1 Tax=Aeromonas phage Ah1 TaxID=2053701 RepID=A0A2H4YF91_9CAUD|nr:DNA methyltransferase [Aeromonas phage Ah1]AUE22644.1 hypothetical protein Ah1_00103 [Aeromonas phage Ah1]